MYVFNQEAERQAQDYNRPSDEEMNSGLSIVAVTHQLDQILSQLILGEDLTETEIQVNEMISSVRRQ